MLDFTPVRNKQITMNELAEGLTIGDLRSLTNEMVDHVLDLIKDSVDADVTFEPEDPAADDKAAATSAEVNMPWTLGHVIVHITASTEESAFLAAELARGVPHRGGRSRYETPWQTVTTIEQCRQRLEENRRMRLASLDVWPNPPHLDNTYQAREDGPHYGPLARFIMGLSHDDSHLGQLADVIKQAKAARS
jgi:hypothetical protein